MKHDRRGSWYLLTGAVLGVVLGLFYSWMVSPVRYIDAPPYALRADYKQEYRALVAAAYLYSGDLVRAQDRLAQLRDTESAQTIAMQAQRAVADGYPEEEIRALNLLAEALSHGLTPMPYEHAITPSSTLSGATGTATPAMLLIEPSASLTTTIQAGAILTYTLQAQLPTHTPGPSPTPTPTSTQGAPFVLQDSRMVCNQAQAGPLIQVEVNDAAGQPVPGVELVVTWEAGEDHFFTGLQPELGFGYGDFLMTPGVAYSIHLLDGGQAVDDLTPAACVAEDGSQYWGSWYLIFVQP